LMWINCSSARTTTVSMFFGYYPAHKAELGPEHQCSSAWQSCPLGVNYNLAP